MKNVLNSRDFEEKGGHTREGKEMEGREKWKESCFMPEHGKNTLILPQIWKEDTISLCLNALLGAEHAGTAVSPRSR